MSDAFRKDVTEGDTERTRLTHIAADNLAMVWYSLDYPRRYQSVRTVQGHRCVVTVEDAEDFAERLRRYAAGDKTPLVRERDLYEA